MKHKDGFIRKDDPLIHTQTIENRWGQVKGLMKKRGKISRINFHDKLKEITWRITNKLNIQESLLNVIVISNTHV